MRLLLIVFLMFMLGLISYLCAYIFTLENMFFTAFDQIGGAPRLITSKTSIYSLVVFAVAFLVVIAVITIATSVRRERVEV